jgi:hypothetical protein
MAAGVCKILAYLTASNFLPFNAVKSGTMPGLKEPPSAEPANSLMAAALDFLAALVAEI